MKRPGIYVPRRAPVYTERNPCFRALMGFLGVFNIAGGGFVAATSEPTIGLICIGAGIGCLIDASIKYRRMH